ncbi:MAG: CRTAC1 family protein [Gaiellales bacterium]
MTEANGLVMPLTGMRGHAAAWGDVNGDSLLDLFVGTFADRPVDEYEVRGAPGPSPDRLLLGEPTAFGTDGTFPEEFGRTSAAAFADLDADGDLDLVVSRNTRPEQTSAAVTEILENQDGMFRVVGDSGLPFDLAARSVGVLDVNGDGLLDLFIAEDRWGGGSSILLRNSGQLRFTDVTEDAGLPTDVHGLGVGTSDLTGDGNTDLFVAGSNRLFVANGDGTFREADSAVFQWQTYGTEDDVSGVAIADVNRDALPDIVLGHHFNSTLEIGARVPVRLYLHRGLDPMGDPVFEDVTEASGLVDLPTKAPHVEIQDFDNDGWPDILATASSRAGTSPVVFRHMGLEGDIPRFATPDGLGSPQYWITGPVADVDRDGRLDVFLAEWEPALPSLLLHNETASGNWISVSVGPEHSGGIGARVTIFREGELGERGGMLGTREIFASSGYAAGVPAHAHFGLGSVSIVDVRVELPDGGAIELTSVRGNRHLRLPSGCTGRG